MKRVIIFFSLVVFLSACRKEKRFMENLTANWIMEKSEKSYIDANGNEQVFESLSNAGTLVVYKNGDSDEERMFDWFFIDSNLDTTKITSKLMTDETKKRLIFVNAINGNQNLVWTVEKEKRNKQVWSVYGVDSVLCYPSNNNNPGAAGNWIVWRMTLSRQ